MNKIDLEDAIMKAWQTCDDLDLFFKHYGDHPMPMTDDEVANTILGIKQIHTMRMENLFDMFKRAFELDEYCTDPEALANRAKLFKTVKEINTPKKKGKKDV
jgi:hypothetical protein